jgi:hypothetical protein
MRLLGGQIISQLLSGLMHIAFILDIVALENVPGLVAGLLQRYAFTHASPDQIARRRAPEAREIVWLLTLLLAHSPSCA